MSEENVELALRALDAFRRRDVDAFVALLSPDVVWEENPELPELRFWMVSWFAEGKITRRQVSWARDQALEAAGLSE